MSENTKKKVKKVNKQKNNSTEKVTLTSKEGPTRAPNSLKGRPKPLIVSNTQDKGITVFLWGLLFVVVIGCGIFATKSLWAPSVINYLPKLKSIANNQPSEDLLSNRINQIEEEIISVRKSGQAIADLEIERVRLNKNFEGVMARINALEKQISIVRRMQKATKPPTDAYDTHESLNRLNSRMNKLEKSDEIASVVLERLNKLEQLVADRETSVIDSTKSLSQTMTDISQRIGILESGTAQSEVGKDATTRQKRQVKAQTLVLAVSHLRESLRSSDPFVQSLEALKVLGGHDPDIMSGLKELTPLAQTGIPTMDKLRREYSIVAENIRAAAYKTPANENVNNPISEIFDKVTSVVTVRKTNVDGSERNPVDTAMVQLDEKNLEGAIATLSVLGGAEAAAAGPWLESARGRLMAEKTLSRMHVLVVSLLATSIQEGME